MDVNGIEELAVSLLAILGAGAVGLFVLIAVSMALERFERSKYMRERDKRRIDQLEKRLDVQEKRIDKVTSDVSRYLVE